MSQFTLFSNEHVILLQPNKPNRPILKISRPNGEISLLPASEYSSTSFGPFDLSFKCYGIYGMIELLAGKYLIVVKEQSLVASLPGNEAEIRQIRKVEIVPCGIGKEGLLASGLERDEQKYLNLLELALNQSAPMASGLFYSPTAPLSRSLQSQFIDKNLKDTWKQSAIEGNDDFVVNSAHLKDFQSVSPDQISDFICFCIQGFVEVRDLVVNQTNLTFALISRRNVARTGARYHCRGIDLKGNVANFVETEQAIFTPEGRCASFLQIRGSIPLFWRQNVRIKYKPELEIVKDAPSEKSFRAHREKIIRKYKRVSIANLVDSHGGEADLSAIFNELSKLDSEEFRDLWNYIEFDFHLQCKNMAYQNIEKLIDSMEEELNIYGYFEGNLREDNKVLKEQEGIVRTNCMDCLDRTNVVQSALGRRALLCQLKDFGILPSEASSEDFGESLIGIFRNVWADNADAISTQYSGTGALKTDFTRTGKRSLMGALQDGINSALRYYYGNFSDGVRQDSLDLLFGNYKIDTSKSYKSPFKSHQSNWIKTIVTSTLFYSICVFFFFAHFNNLKGMALSVFTIVLLLQFIKMNGKLFVQKPRLSQKLN